VACTDPTARGDPRATGTTSALRAGNYGLRTPGANKLPAMVDATPSRPRVAVFGPTPLLGITIERRGDGEEVHLHPAGQGVWVARMAGELGTDPVLCAFSGGEVGALLGPLLGELPGELRLVRTTGESGAYVIDRRSGERESVAQAWAPAPSRHEIDDLFALACAAGLHAGALAVCGAAPHETMPVEVYGNLVTDVRANGTPVIVDLSTEPLGSALTGGPDVVKLNDWQLAETVRGPVDRQEDLLGAARSLLARGAGSVVVTRAGEPAVALRGDEVWELTPPRFERGSREGCGDSMTGAIAAGMALGLEWGEALRLGAAAGAANFLRHGLGTGAAVVVRDLLGKVRLQRLVT